jgi:O-acetyl-ADP-ribose deacetylase (regulator of RNase III)
VSAAPALQLVLVAIEPPHTKAWRTYCGDVPGVSVHEGSIFDVEGDAVVSPANSFGFMDGGIDLAYMEAFGEVIQTRVQMRILELHGGELVVGQADIVETEHASVPFLIVAPTMRVPLLLPRTTVNPYLVARAVFRLWVHGRFTGGARDGERIRDHVRRVAMPGLGNGVGEVDPTTCARQVWVAYEEFILGGYEMPSSWVEASRRHQLLYQPRHDAAS